MPVEMCTNNRIVGELLSVATQRDVVTGHQLPRLGSPYDTAPTEFSVEGRRPIRICCLICENLCTIVMSLSFSVRWEAAVDGLGISLSFCSRKSVSLPLLLHHTHLPFDALEPQLLRHLWFRLALLSL